MAGIPIEREERATGPLGGHHVLDPINDPLRRLDIRQRFAMAGLHAYLTTLQRYNVRVFRDRLTEGIGERARHLRLRDRVTCVDRERTLSIDVELLDAAG